MELAFLNRRDEKTRLTRLFSARQGTFACVYGRRRCGKSRLLLEVIKRRKAVYHVADERNAPLQRQSVAAAIAARIPGFDEVESIVRSRFARLPDQESYLPTASPIRF